MSTIGERLYSVRKKLGLNQTVFGKKIGVSQTAIGQYENGTRNITDRVILQVCQVYNISETWLRTGEGGEETMFQKSEDSVIAQLADRYSLDTKGKAVIKAFLSLTREQQDVIVTAVCAAAEEVKRAQEADRKDAEKKKAALEESDQLLNTTFDCKEDDAAALHQQLDQELAAEKKDAQESSAGGSGMGSF